MSGSGADAAGETEAAGFDQRLVKPFSLDQILAPIDAFFTRAAVR
jgi:DNA-binding response OmpR family regulator